MGKIKILFIFTITSLLISCASTSNKNDYEKIDKEYIQLYSNFYSHYFDQLLEPIDQVAEAFADYENFTPQSREFTIKGPDGGTSEGRINVSINMELNDNGAEIKVKFEIIAEFYEYNNSDFIVYDDSFLNMSIVLNISENNQDGECLIASKIKSRGKKNGVAELNISFENVVDMMFNDAEPIYKGTIVVNGTEFDANILEDFT